MRRLRILFRLGVDVCEDCEQGGPRRLHHLLARLLADGLGGGQYAAAGGDGGAVGQLAGPAGHQASALLPRPVWGFRCGLVLLHCHAAAAWGRVGRLFHLTYCYGVASVPGSGRGVGRIQLDHRFRVLLRCDAHRPPICALPPLPPSPRPMRCWRPPAAVRPRAVPPARRPRLLSPCLAATPGASDRGRVSRLRRRYQRSRCAVFCAFDRQADGAFGARQLLWPVHVSGVFGAGDGLHSAADS
mmetsp:Transcript_53905/g.135469  ORF Transcript_53905/g.135469 Transcript_53905/m.135469 type:complete len:243 (+) Transcript_53905:636-1364(+)